MLQGQQVQQHTGNRPHINFEGERDPKKDFRGTMRRSLEFKVIEVQLFKKRMRTSTGG